MASIHHTTVINTKDSGRIDTSATGPAYSTSWKTTAPSGYKISEHLLNNVPPSRPKFRIVLAGAGASGIDFLHFAREELQKSLGVELVCYEKNSDIGGTWFENRYPGCACDIPSVCYQFTWKPKPDWTKFYSGRQEIWQYFKDIVNEEGLDKYITFRSEVKKAAWNDLTSKWELKIAKSDERGIIKEWDEECDYFVNTTGFLNAWKLPGIKGLHSFEGILTHTANYDETIDLNGKRVVVIGSGSSGIQIIAAIQKVVKELHVCIRGPTWITPSFAQAFAGENGTNFDYSTEQKKDWSENPQNYLAYRKMIEKDMNQRFKFLLTDTKEADGARNFASSEMAKKLNHDPHLVDKIIPKTFNVGCRRPSPGPGYLEALVAPNSTVYTEDIREITPKGFRTSTGEEVEVDIIICATGFDTSFLPRFPIIGLNGVDIRDLWKTKPLSYLSVGVPRIPNYFIYIGPYGPLAHGASLTIIEALTQYLIQVIKKMRHDHIRRLSPSPAATEAFGEHASLYVERTAWVGPCRSWFKQGTEDGPVVMWPGSRLHFFDIMREPRYEDYEIEYLHGNRYGFLGNGFSSREFDGSDTTYYMGNLEE